MRRFLPLTAAVLFACALKAGTWTEVGDAGNNLSGAQIVSGSGLLTKIFGHLSAPGDSTGLVDIYRLYIYDPVNFSAFSSGGVPDPELFLFDVNGYGLEGGRNISSTNLQGFLIGDASGTVPPLTAYLWISAQDRDPACGAAPMFGPGGTEYPNPAGPIGSCTLTGAVGSANAANATGGNYAYTISLTGASFGPVPEPAGIFLAGFGLLALAARRWFR
jgi:hypothetical protein